MSTSSSIKTPITPDEIICPTWCQITKDAHFEDLRGWEGKVIHHSRFGEGIDDWSLTSITTPDGSPVPEGEGAPIQLMFGDSVVDPDIAERVGRRILALVDEARR